MLESRDPDLRPLVPAVGPGGALQPEFLPSVFFVGLWVSPAFFRFGLFRTRITANTEGRGGRAGPPNWAGQSLFVLIGAFPPPHDLALGGVNQAQSPLSGET